MGFYVSFLVFSVLSRLILDRSSRFFWILWGLMAFFCTLWHVLDEVSIFMYHSWSFRYCRGLFFIVDKICLIFGFSYVFLRFFLGFLGTYEKFMIYCYKLLLFIRLFHFFSTHWWFVLILWEFSVNFTGFCEFEEVLWIFLDFMACSSLVLDFYVYFLAFSVLSRLISILYQDSYNYLVFLRFSKIFPRFFGSL